MKKTLSVFLALLFCAVLVSPAVAASDAGYGKLTVSDLIAGTWDASDLTVEFEAARLEIGSFYVTLDGENLVQFKDVKIVTVKPGSKVTVKDSVSGDTSQVMGLVMLQGYFAITGINEPIAISSGSISDWPFGELFPAFGEQHTLGLVMLSGASEIYYVRLGEGGSDEPSTPSEPSTPPTPSAPPESGELKVVRTSQRLTVDGEEKNAEIYNINDKNYFKLRDIAALLNGTGSQFSVDYDAASKSISITTGAPYDPDGSELVIGDDKSATCVASSQSVLINGEKVSLTAYNLGGYNFFGLRDLGSALGFDVDYDASTRTMIVTTK